MLSEGAQGGGEMGDYEFNFLRLHSTMHFHCVKKSSDEILRPFVKIRQVATRNFVSK